MPPEKTSKSILIQLRRKILMNRYMANVNIIFDVNLQTEREIAELVTIPLLTLPSS